MLQKKTVKELRSVLREYKKIHCKPYSRLKKAQMIELIKYHGISEHDIEKTGKIKTQSKPKSKIKSVRAEHEALLKNRTQSRTNSQRTVSNADKKMERTQRVQKKRQLEQKFIFHESEGDLGEKFKNLEDSSIYSITRDGDLKRNIDDIMTKIRYSNLYKNNKKEAGKIEKRYNMLMKKIEFIKKQDHDKQLLLHSNRSPEDKQYLDFGNVLYSTNWSKPLKDEHEAKQKNRRKVQTKIKKLGTEIRKRKKEK
jgi:hypothetical protein